jgi:hypothetical protein
MARYRGPKSKIARKFNDPIFGPSKALQKNPTARDNTAEVEERSNLNMPFS